MTQVHPTQPEGDTGLDGATVVHADGTVALRDVTLLARPGELLAVLGPSGSGKSSLLRAIAGLMTVQRGRVLIRGEATTAPTAARNVAMVFENAQLVPFLTVARNMGFGLETRHVSSAEVTRQVENQSRRLRVSRLLHRMPDQISAGERGQVGIGRALVRTPRVFLLDEPLAHVDAQERARMRRVIAESVRASKVSTIYVTHDQVDALAIGDRIAVINHGQVAQVGTSRALYDRPDTLFVADFVGVVPLGKVTGTVVESAGMLGFRVGFRTLPTWRPMPPELVGHLGRQVILGLRGEDVREADDNPDPDHAVLTGRVRGIDRNGRDAFVRVQVGEHRLVARFGGGTRVRIDDEVRLAVDAAAAHVFDAETGVALYHPQR